jgi:hypothetical protein
LNSDPSFLNPSDILAHDRRRTVKPLPPNIVSATAAYQKHLGNWEFLAESGKLYLQISAHEILTGSCLIC